MQLRHIALGRLQGVASVAPVVVFLLPLSPEHSLRPEGASLHSSFGHELIDLTQLRSHITERLLVSRAFTVALPRMSRRLPAVWGDSSKH